MGGIRTWNMGVNLTAQISHPTSVVQEIFRPPAIRTAPRMDFDLPATFFVVSDNKS